MFVETFLPFDDTTYNQWPPERSGTSACLASRARRIEELGFSTLHIGLSRTDPFQPVSIGAAATSQLQLAISTAVYPRSPTAIARSTWALQSHSGGRVLLGLRPATGSLAPDRQQVPWTPLAPHIRDYVLAIRAVWRGWQEQQPVEFESDHYRIDMSLPTLDPKPIASPDIPIQIAGVSEALCEIAGEVANGIRLAPLCTQRHINKIVRPALLRGAAKTGRNNEPVEVCIRPLVGAAPDHKSLMRKTEDTRARLAFYLSVPAYRTIFELHGWGSDARKARRLANNNHWQKLPALVSDDMLHTFATIGTYEDIAEKLLDRFEGCADRIEYSTANLWGPELEALPSIIGALSNQPTRPNRQSGGGARTKTASGTSARAHISTCTSPPLQLASASSE